MTQTERIERLKQTLRDIGDIALRYRGANPTVKNAFVSLIREMAENALGEQDDRV